MITFRNKGAERIFGFSESEAVGQTLDIIIPEDLGKRHWDGFAETVRIGKTRYGARLPSDSDFMTGQTVVLDGGSVTH